jgi:hypothetical protein
VRLSISALLPPWLAVPQPHSPAEARPPNWPVARRPPEAMVEPQMARSDVSLPAVCQQPGWVERFQPRRPRRRA